MNHKQIVQTGLLATLIVSPTIALLAIQMPFWLPPKQVALKRVVYAEVDPPWDYPGRTSWAATGGADTSAYKCARRYDDCEVIRASIGTDPIWSSPSALLRFDFVVPSTKGRYDIEALRLAGRVSF